jgi:hypothetical protein
MPGTQQAGGWDVQKTARPTPAAFGAKSGDDSYTRSCGHGIWNKTCHFSNKVGNISAPKIFVISSSVALWSPVGITTNIYNNNSWLTFKISKSYLTAGNRF